MVVHQSDSTGTLVSLDHHHDDHRGLKQAPEAQEGGSTTQVRPQQELLEEDELFVPTLLMLEVDDDYNDLSDSGDDDDGDESDDQWIMESASLASASVPADVSLSDPAATTRPRQPKHTPLYLPQTTDRAQTTTATNSHHHHHHHHHHHLRIDEYLQRLPQLQERRDQLLAAQPRRFSQRSSSSDEERFLYVAQGERANAVCVDGDGGCDCDDDDDDDDDMILLSDRATTCHILAMRSTVAVAGGTGSTSPPLASMSHLDGTQYGTCIRDMIREHVLHHRHHQHCEQQQRGENEEEKKMEGADTPAPHITLELHIVGGFEDAHGTSAALSDWLIRLLADLADEFASQVTMVLQTCVVSAMNSHHRSSPSPVGRGLGMNIRTGDVFLARCDADATGPAAVLRSVYLWSRPQRLRLIHNVVVDSSTTCPTTTKHHGQLVVEPFFFEPFGDIETLLKLNDLTLLQCTSTSPDVEEDDFCDSIRRSLQFLRQVSCHDVFGPNLDQPLVFERSTSTCLSSSSSNNKRKNVNEWILVR